MRTNSPKKPETPLRRHISSAMVGLWLRTWHEDKEISPGVPDLSYVLLGGGYETGWLELKAVPDSELFKFKIEPSQHQWIRNHHKFVPVHFLVAVGDNWYIVPGKHHEQLAGTMTKPELQAISVHTARYPLDPAETLRLLESFKTFTRRHNVSVQGI